MIFVISVYYIQVVLTFTYNSFYTIYMLYIFYFVVCNISFFFYLITIVNILAKNVFLDISCQA